MSKIVCDICGTSYPENAKQCPICGCVRPGDAQRVGKNGSGDEKGTSGYTHSKGGHYSKSNVKKRTKKSSSGKPAEKPSGRKGEANPNAATARGLIVTAVILLLAIIGVLIYIFVRLFAPVANPNPDSSTPTDNTTLPVQIDLSCKGLILDVETVNLSDIGDGYLLSVKKQPENSTDVITFTSENPSVATVSDAGNIVSVGVGITKITVRCGQVVKECVVVCTSTAVPPTGTTTTPTTQPTTTPTTTETIKLNRFDITFSFKGESWMLYSGSVAKNLITWSSDNENIVTFVDGKATAIGPGTTNIHAEYNGQKVSCIIRCVFQEEGGSSGNGGVTEDGGGTTQTTTTPTTTPTTPENPSNPSDPSTTDPTGGTNQPTTPVVYSVYNHYGDKTNDVTIQVGEKVGLYLRAPGGDYISVEWMVNGKSCTASGSQITGTASGTSTVIASYEGKTYTCIIRVI